MPEPLVMEFPKVERTCSTCACYFQQPHPENPKAIQGFCRLKKVLFTQMNIAVAAVDRFQKPMFDKTGAPRMVPERRDVFIYDPTPPNGTCFDGWRPLGTLPGERWDSGLDRDQARERARVMVEQYGAPPEIVPDPVQE
jgi:hypothetical protein